MVNHRPEVSINLTASPLVLTKHLCTNHLPTIRQRRQPTSPQRTNNTSELDLWATTTTRLKPAFKRSTRNSVLGRGVLED